MRRYRSWITAGAAVLLLLTAPTAAAQAAPVPSGRILYLQFTGEEDLGTLHSSHPDGSAATDLGLSQPRYGLPDYSPDGTRIAYTQEFSFRSMAADGTDDRWLVDAPWAPANPRWSPDGKWVVGESGGDIVRVSKDGHEAGWSNLTEAAGYNDLEASYAPNGRRFATATYPGVQIYRADGTWLRTLTDLPEAYRLDWNPRGDRIAVEAQGDIWLVDATSGAVTRVTDTPNASESSPVWSPDGRWLAYAYSNYGADPVIWLMNRNGGDQHTTGILGIPTSWRAQP